MAELSTTSITDDIVDRFRNCTSFECFQLGFPDQEILKLMFGGKDKCGGIYMSLGIHNYKLVDCEVLVMGDFGLTVFTPESWSSVAKYFFTTDSGFDVSCVQLDEYSWNSLRNQEELVKCLEEMDSLGSKASATFYHLTCETSQKIPKGCAFSLRNLSDQFTHGIVTFGVDEMEVSTLPHMFHHNVKFLGRPQQFVPFEDEKMQDNVSLVQLYDIFEFEIYRRIEFPCDDSVSLNELYRKVSLFEQRKPKRTTVDLKEVVEPVKKKSKIVQQNNDARQWVGTDVFGATLWDNDNNGCFVSAFLAMCMVVKQLLQMSNEDILLLTPLARLVFSGLPELISPNDAVSCASSRFTKNKKHKDEVRRCMSELFGACKKKPAKGCYKYLMDNLVEPPLQNIEPLFEGESFEATESQFVKTEHILWFSPFEKKSKCMQCGFETKISGHGLLEKRNNYFKWTEQRVLDAKEGCMFAKYFESLLIPWEQVSYPCAQIIDVASSSQCRFMKVMVTQQLLSAKLKDIVVVYTYTDNMHGTPFSVDAEERNMRVTTFGVEYQLVGIVSYPTNSRVHFVSHWFDGRNWWKYDDLVGTQGVTGQRCAQVIVNKFSSLDSMYVFANVANVINL